MIGFPHYGFIIPNKLAMAFKPGGRTISGTDWLEVPTIYSNIYIYIIIYIILICIYIYYKAYFSSLCFWESPHKIWPEIWYRTSILGSWNSHWSSINICPHLWWKTTQKNLRWSTQFECCQQTQTRVLHTFWRQSLQSLYKPIILAILRYPANNQILSWLVRIPYQKTILD